MLDHRTRRGALASEGERHRAEIACATAGNMVAVARGHGLMDLRIEQRQGGVRVCARLRELSAHERGRPHRVMGLDPQADVIEFFRQCQQPRAQPLPRGRLAAAGAEHPLAPDRGKQIGALAKAIAKRLRAGVSIEHFRRTKSTCRYECGA